jgi:hypothetical protein
MWYPTAKSKRQKKGQALYLIALCLMQNGWGFLKL